jgi:hypothetical protein
MNFDDYQDLLNRFLEGAIRAVDFQTAYLEKFKHEARTFPDGVFDVLDALFADVDAFCPDKALFVQLNQNNPGFYIDEAMLRARVSEASELLKKCRFPRPARAM